MASRLGPRFTAGAYRPSVPRWGGAALPERKIDPLHHEIMDFAALLEGGLAQRLIYSFGQIEARMDHIGPGPAPRGLPGRFCGRLGEFAALGHARLMYGLPRP